MNPVARAFELARSGNYSDVERLKRQLRQEGYISVDAHLDGRTIKAQLNELMRAASRGKEGEPAQEG